MSRNRLASVTAAGLLAAFSILSIQGCGRAGSAPPASIVLITIDTLRADYERMLSVFGISALDSEGPGCGDE